MKLQQHNKIIRDGDEHSECGSLMTQIWNQYDLLWRTAVERGHSRAQRE